MLRILIITFALVSSISVDAQNEVIGAYVKKGEMVSGINTTSRFPMYSVISNSQSLFSLPIPLRNHGFLM